MSLTGRLGLLAAVLCAPAMAADERYPEQNQTTVGMMDCHLMESRIWDARLNAEYQQVMASFEAEDAVDASYGTSGRRAETLRDAQRAWIAFRDAECSNRYALWGSGSMRLIEGAICRSELTALRILDLIDKREWPN